MLTQATLVKLSMGVRGELAHGAKVPAAEPDKLSSIPTTSMVEKDN